MHENSPSKTHNIAVDAGAERRRHLKKAKMSKSVALVASKLEETMNLFKESNLKTILPTIQNRPREHITSLSPSLNKYIQMRYISQLKSYRTNVQPKPTSNKRNADLDDLDKISSQIRSFNTIKAPNTGASSNHNLCANSPSRRPAPQAQDFSKNLSTGFIDTSRWFA